MDIVFFGTPTFALDALDALMLSRHRVVAVVSQPNRALDRKGRLLTTPVAAYAEKTGITLYQFESVKGEGVEALKGLNADIFVTAAYGQILSQEILDIPRLGTVNIHASLLPKYRGSSPVHHAVLNGDKKTGVTIMRTTLAMDSGEIILQAETDINPAESTVDLTKRLSRIGADLLLDALGQIEAGTAVYLPQNDEKAVYCGKITSQMSKIDWRLSAEKINNLVRAVGGASVFNNRGVKITKAAAFSTREYFLANEYLASEYSGESNTASGSSPTNEYNDEYNTDFFDINNKTHGAVLPSRHLRLFVKCGEGVLEITELTPAGGRAVTGREFLTGLKGKGNIDFKALNGEDGVFE